MKKLTKKEEEIMQALWQLKNAFVKEVVDALPVPKPHYNTVSTMLKILEEKQFIGHERYGNMLRYSPIVSKDSYQTDAVGDIIEKYFDNSYVNLVTHFAKNENISRGELEDILTTIKNNK
ncbi:MAG: BlaI/MecI/CopY family transcriptional regulator [Saprospiraceae bacterium]|nr:BlaI/MecI/CopY family transcriptional regulator [Saprospiraceae bacterium]|tara:strand:+ start:2431 stop:2790 length:360 start_codon:yes stop_codon:yes gene_type:complete